MEILKNIAGQILDKFWFGDHLKLFLVIYSRTILSL